MNRFALPTLILAAALGAAAPEARPQSDRKPNGKAPSLEQTLAWLKKLDISKESADTIAKLTVDDLKTLTTLNLGGHRQSDGKHVNFPAPEYRYLTSLPALEMLNLNENEGVTDEALAHVGRIATLKELHVADGKITGAGLGHLANLKNLTHLNVGWTLDVGDAALPLFVKFPKLEFLGLGATKVTEAGLVANIPRMPCLKELHLNGLAISDAGFARIAECRTLAKIEVSKKDGAKAAKLRDAIKRVNSSCEIVVSKY